MEDAEAMEDVEESPVSLAAADGAELGTAKNDEAATEDEVGSIAELPKSRVSTDWEGAASEAEAEVDVELPSKLAASADSEGAASEEEVKVDVELPSKSAAAIDWVGREEEAEGSAEVLFEEGPSAVGS